MQETTNQANLNRSTEKKKKKKV
jgi:elongation factor 1-alpha